MILIDQKTMDALVRSCQRWERAATLNPDAGKDSEAFLGAFHGLDALCYDPLCALYHPAMQPENRHGQGRWEDMDWEKVTAIMNSSAVCEGCPVRTHTGLPLCSYQERRDWEYDLHPDGPLANFIAAAARVHRVLLGVLANCAVADSVTVPGG